MSKAGVYEPLAVKKQIIKSATEASTMILKIDDVIAAGKMRAPPTPPGGGPGGCQVEDTQGWGSTRTRLAKAKITIGPPKITRFEKARIVGARALQISMGAPILVEVSEGGSSPINIALKELDSDILPMTIRRTLPDGTYQDIPLKWLLAEP